MSVYLKDSNVLLDAGGNVATDSQCCCGACCIDGDCYFQSHADCDAQGGTYQGDGVPCDPNPCMPQPQCACGFEAFDGSGRRFLTKTYVSTGHCTGGGGCDWDNSTAVVTYDPITCIATLVTCSGTITCPLGPFSWTPGGTDYDLVGEAGLNCGTPNACGCTASACGRLLTQTATEQTFDSGCLFGTGGCTHTLSDECTPI